MPKIIEKMPRIGRGKSYWDEFADGVPREFVQGEDFTVSSVNFVSMARAYALRRGHAVAAVIRGQRVWLQITPHAALKAIK